MLVVIRVVLPVVVLASIGTIEVVLVVVQAEELVWYVFGNSTMSRRTPIAGFNDRVTRLYFLLLSCVSSTILSNHRGKAGRVYDRVRTMTTGSSPGLVHEVVPVVLQVQGLDNIDRGSQQHNTGIEARSQYFVQCSEFTRGKPAGDNLVQSKRAQRHSSCTFDPNICAGK